MSVNVSKLQKIFRDDDDERITAMNRELKAWLSGKDLREVIDKMLAVDAYLKGDDEAAPTKRQETE